MLGIYRDVAADGSRIDDHQYRADLPPSGRKKHQTGDRQQRDHHQPYCRKGVEPGTGEDGLEVGSGQIDTQHDHGKRSVHARNGPHGGAKELRHRDTAEVDHHTAQQGEYQRIFEHCPQLDVLFVTGKLCLAVGPLQSIQQGHKTGGVEYGFAAQHRRDQWKPHEPGVGKCHTDLRHGIFAEKEPRHRHGEQQHPGTRRNADSQFHSSLCRILNTK